MTIAIFGDSHAGRLKRTWDRTVRGNSEWRTEWFIHRSMGIHPMKFKDEDGDTVVEIANTPMIDDIVFRKDDLARVLVNGMGPCMQWAMELAKDFAHPEIGHTSSKFLTSSTWESALLDAFRHSNAAAVMHAVRRVAPEIPLYFLPPVRPVYWVNNREDHVKAWSIVMAESDSKAKFNDLFLRVIKKFCECYDAILVDQPQVTVRDYCWTAHEFGLADYENESDRSWVRGDYFHSNDLYASLLMNHLSERGDFASLPHSFT